MKKDKCRLLTAPADSAFVRYSLRVKDMQTIKIECGNKATDYSESPEDSDQHVDDNIQNVREELLTSIEQQSDSIILEVAKKHYLKDETDSLVSELSTRLEQTSNSFNFEFNKFHSEFESMQNDTTAEFENISKYIRFVDGDIIIGQSDSAVTLTLENDRIVFKENGVEVHYIQEGTTYFQDGIFTRSMQVGNFAFVPRSNGSLSFDRII